jgi:hypothetical protein
LLKNDQIVDDELLAANLTIKKWKAEICVLMEFAWWDANPRSQTSTERDSLARSGMHRRSTARTQITRRVLKSSLTLLIIPSKGCQITAQRAQDVADTTDSLQAVACTL